MKDGKHVILCIDDDKDLLDSTRIILEGEGFVMEQAQSAQEGLQAFRETGPDLVVVDLMMEEVDAGTRFVKEIKAMGSDVPIIMLSSVGEELGKITSYSELGLAGVLQKPINPNVLVKTIKKKLE